MAGCRRETMSVGGGQARPRMRAGITAGAGCQQEAMPVPHRPTQVSADCQQDVPPVGAAPALQSTCAATCPGPLDYNRQRRHINYKPAPARPGIRAGTRPWPVVHRRQR